MESSSSQCPDCLQKFSCHHHFTAHLVLCIATTRRKADQNVHFYGLGLVPKTVAKIVAAEKDKRMFSAKCSASRYFSASRNTSISSKLGQILFGGSLDQKKAVSSAAKIEKFCSDDWNVVQTRSARKIPTKPDVDKPHWPSKFVSRRGLKDNLVQIKFTGAERRYFDWRQRELCKMIKHLCQTLSDQNSSFT